MKHNLLFVFITITTFVYQATAQDEIFLNPDFEESFDGNWICSSCVIEQTDEDSNTGQFSGKVTERQTPQAGVAQFVDLEEGQNYFFYMYIKLLMPASEDQYLHNSTFWLEIQYEDGSEENVTIGRNWMLRVDRGWQRFGGDFYFEDAASSVKLYLELEDIAVNYLVDTASLMVIPDDPDWKEEANQRISDIRMQDLTINIDVPDDLDPNLVQVEIALSKHLFPFGTAIFLDRWLNTSDPAQERYKEVFYENFNYAVTENGMKWRTMEMERGIIDFERPDEFIAELQTHGIPVRGHAVFWGFWWLVPDWMKLMAGPEVEEEVQRRIDYMMPRYSGNITNWDVYNEHLHYQFFERRTGRYDILDWMFRECFRQDPTAQLFLNDFGVINGLDTIAYVNEAEELLELGSPLHGLGVQSHISGWFDIRVMAHRLDLVAEVGLPVWITELDIEIEDRENRADAYADTLRMLFSRPEVEGVLIWGFWDQQHWRPDCALWEGDDIQPNEAGLRWQQLLQEEWSTQAIIQPEGWKQSSQIRAFQGTYTVDIIYDGESICRMDDQHQVGKGEDAVWDILIESC